MNRSTLRSRHQLIDRSPALSNCTTCSPHSLSSGFALNGFLSSRERWSYLAFLAECLLPFFRFFFASWHALLLDAIHLAFGLGDCLNSSEWLEDSCWFGCGGYWPMFCSVCAKRPRQASRGRFPLGFLMWHGPYLQLSRGIVSSFCLRFTERCPPCDSWTGDFLPLAWNELADRGRSTVNREAFAKVVL